MDDAIFQRTRRLYAAIGDIEEEDLNKLRATILQKGKTKRLSQDFRGDLSDADSANYAYTLVHNIANMEDHLRRWAAHNGHDKAKVHQAVDNSLDLQIIKDLSNNDKHGYPPRGGGRSRKYPQLVGISRVMQLQTQAKKGSSIGMTVGANGVPRVFGDGTAKAIITGDVVDNKNNRIGDFHEIATKSVEAWEQLLADFGFKAITNAT